MGAILLPPLAVAVTDPDVFFTALDNAGTFGISLLCGVLPAAMAWRQRYTEASAGGEGGDEEEGTLATLATLPLVPGGKATLTGEKDVQVLPVTHGTRYMAQDLRATCCAVR